MILSLVWTSPAAGSIPVENRILKLVRVGCVSKREQEELVENVWEPHSQVSRRRGYNNRTPENSSGQQHPTPTSVAIWLLLLSFWLFLFLSFLIQSLLKSYGVATEDRDVREATERRRSRETVQKEPILRLDSHLLHESELRTNATLDRFNTATTQSPLSSSSSALQFFFCSHSTAFPFFRQEVLRLKWERENRNGNRGMYKISLSLSLSLPNSSLSLHYSI